MKETYRWSFCLLVFQDYIHIYVQRSCIQAHNPFIHNTEVFLPAQLTPAKSLHAQTYIKPTTTEINSEHTFARLNPLAK